MENNDNGYQNNDTGEYHYSYTYSNSDLNNETFFKPNVKVNPEGAKPPKKRYGVWAIVISVILSVFWELCMLTERMRRIITALPICRA